MKYVILIGDGMADYPIPERDNKTALQTASTPNLDFIATEGMCGEVQTISKGMDAGSDIAILSILGYDPARYYTGRGPLEALGMHIPLDEGDIAFRCNLVTENRGRLEDYSGGHITNGEAKGLIEALNEELRVKEEEEKKGWQIDFYPGMSYRNVLVLKSKDYDLGNEKEIGGAPPHDIIGARVEEELPKEEILRNIVLASREILEKHEINVERASKGKKKANMIWLWSGGRKPTMPEFREMYGVSGSVISAVFLLKGVGRCVGLDVIDVPGATGYIDTNYAGKAEYALRSLKDHDFVLVHVEAPDEAAHIGDIDMKVKAIEDFDALVVGKMLGGLEDEFADEGYKVLAMSDHYTPVSLKTHTKEPVPFAIYRSQAQVREQNKQEGGRVRGRRKDGGFDEVSARKSDLGVLDARAGDLMHYFFTHNRSLEKKA
ncbi:cofactor-independent phosphoglycerate mutase [Methanosarcinales archaeon]|nr:MAG: cofactor-independent phosphoglycerate mutase [Methanosarcinales archaeon]